MRNTHNIHNIHTLHTLRPITHTYIHTDILYVYTHLTYIQTYTIYVHTFTHREYHPYVTYIHNIRTHIPYTKSYIYHNIANLHTRVDADINNHAQTHLPNQVWTNEQTHLDLTAEANQGRTSRTLLSTAGCTALLASCRTLPVCKGAIGAHRQASARRYVRATLRGWGNWG